MAVSLEALFRDHGDMVYRVCLRYVKNKDTASDLAQDVFLRVNGKLESFRGDSSSLTWVYRIAVNISLDFLRMQKRRANLAKENISEFVSQNIESKESSTLATLTLNKILEEEDDNTREILFMAYGEGLTHDEMSRIIGVSRVAITKRLNKFKEQFSVKKYE